MLVRTLACVTWVPEAKEPWQFFAIRLLAALKKWAIWAAFELVCENPALLMGNAWQHGNPTLTPTRRLRHLQLVQLVIADNSNTNVVAQMCQLQTAIWNQFCIHASLRVQCLWKIVEKIGVADCTTKGIIRKKKFPASFHGGRRYLVFHWLRVIETL